MTISFHVFNMSFIFWGLFVSICLSSLINSLCDQFQFTLFFHRKWPAHFSTPFDRLVSWVHLIHSGSFVGLADLQHDFLTEGRIEQVAKH